MGMVIAFVSFGGPLILAVTLARLLTRGLLRVRREKWIDEVAELRGVPRSAIAEAFGPWS
ncbi:MAG: hypothetical protein ACYC8T_27475 [Myxococcaceae bacterium]